jgi:hypothetical protein
MICECCSKLFKNINGLTKHMMQHNKNCYDFYIKKYRDRSNFPWRRTSQENNRNQIICEICYKHCMGQRGISIHILQHSQKCYDGYVLKYGGDRSKWPEETNLQIRVCFDCGKVLSDPRVKKYCDYCRQNNHNVMKQPETILKMANSLKETYKNNPNLAKNISIRMKQRFKDRPELCESQRQYMLNGGASHALSFVSAPSKPQLILFNLIQTVAPYPILEYTYLNKSIDIAIPSLSIAIEYDGSYWHQDKEYHEKRQKLLEEDGWKFIRYVDRLPSKKELLKDINNIL